MVCKTHLAWLGVLAVALLTTAAPAQYPSELVGFNDNPDVDTSREMFQIPQVSGTTDMFIVHNDPNTYNKNNASRRSGFQTEGAAALDVFFEWVNATDPDAWVRLTTLNGAVRPNPSVHTEGKVRFKLTNLGDFVDGEIGLCLGIRETGFDVPQLADGGTVGTIEWVGVDNSALTLIKAGPNGTIESTLGGDDQIVDVDPDPVATALVISWGANRVFESTWDDTSDDVPVYGAYASLAGRVTPIPAITLDLNFFPNPLYWNLEWNLATGVVSIDGVPQGGGIAGFTGDGDLTAPSSRGTLEHIAITNVAGDPTPFIHFTIDELQFEAPVPDPVPPPTVVWPIIAGDTEVTVTDLMGTVDQVVLYLDGGPLQTRDVTSPEDVVFTIAPADTGQVYQAKQRNGQNGVYSPLSAGVTVLPYPPTYTFSLLVDQGGTGSCDYTTGGWEWVGVTALPSSYEPVGQPLFTSDGVWQTVDVPLDDDDLVLPGLGGNGELGPSPNGVYTIDSIWFTLSDPTVLGPWEVFIDAVQIIDEFGQVGATILDMEDGVNRLMYQRGQSPDGPTSSALSSVTSYDGQTSHRLLWSYNGTAPESIGMLQRIAYQCGTSALIPDTASAVRFHLLCRGQRQAPGIPLPEVVAPIVGNQAAAQIATSADATAIQLYVNGVPYGSPVTPTGTLTDIAVPLALGDSVSATQTLPAGTSDLAYPRAAGPPVPPAVQAPILVGATTVTVQNCLTAIYATASLVTVYADGQVAGTAPGGTASVAVSTAALAEGTVVTATQTVNGVESAPSRPVVVGQPPGPPTVNPPLEAGDLTVNLTNVNPLASLVTVYANGVPIGSMDPAGATAVAVPVTPLVHLDQITATASNASGEGAHSSPAKEVGRGNGDVLITLGIRETGTTAAIGEDGGIANGIEWLGAATTLSGAPQGKPLYPSNSWQTITFNPATDPVLAFAGSTANGVLSSPTNKGTLEHVAVAVNAASPGRSVGTYVLYIDNIVNVGAGPGGSDALVNDFEAYSVGQLVMFRQPSFSGSTSGHLEGAPTPNISRISDAQGNPGKSVELSWYFKTSTADRWVRLTTYSTTAAPLTGGNPTVDLTKPIRMNVLLLAVLPPPAPTLVSPLVQGQTTVTVTGVDPAATLVTVYANDAPIGSLNPAGNTTVDVPVAGLLHLDRITAKQTGPGGTSGASAALEVGKGVGDVRICIGVRETNDQGPLGTPGGTSGDIEWIGASGTLNNAPQGKPISPSNEWQTLVFDPLADPITAFLGTGALEVGRGTLEHLAVTVNAASPDRSTGPYTLYVDNVVNVGAGPGGSDFLITGFEGFALGSEVLFQEPGYSGSTDMHLAEPPDFSATAAAGNPGQSQLLSWFWRDTTDQRWVRVTTAGTANVPNPIIDLTRPIRLQVVLGEPPSQACPGDFNCDGQITFDDIDPFVVALVSQTCCDPSGANCDPNGDGNIDFNDIDPFVVLLSSGAQCP